MKTLRLLVAAVALLAACDAPGPSAPPPAPRSGVAPTPSPESAAPCDSACPRSPFLGGGGA
jgi:hypothetical protein